MTQSLPSDVTTLVLVRHGETLGNREGRYQVYDTPLSDVGRAQAARLAERLTKEPPADALYCSDLARASETAAIVGRKLGLSPIADAALRELDVGDWKGLLRAEVLEQAPEGFDGWLAAGAIDRLPGEEGECAEDVARRALAWLERTVERHRGGRVIAVSHGLTLMILLAEIHGWDRIDTFRTSRAGQGNTAVNVVEIGVDGGRTCTLLGCVAHLDDLAVVESRAV